MHACLAAKQLSLTNALTSHMQPDLHKKVTKPGLYQHHFSVFEAEKTCDSVLFLCPPAQEMPELLTPAYTQPYSLLLLLLIERVKQM